MSLSCPASVWEQVAKTAESTFPEECCGLLLGPIPSGFHLAGRAVRVDEARPLPNGWEAGPRNNRYALDPKLLMSVESELSGTGRGIVGFYHSHPDAMAWPSPFDLERAWPCYSYWILCVRQGRSDGSRSWVRSEDGLSFREEKVLIGE